MTMSLAADATISFIAGKPGLFTFPAAGYVGGWMISDYRHSLKDLPELDRIKATVMDRRLLRPRYCPPGLSTDTKAPSAKSWSRPALQTTSARSPSPQNQPIARALAW